MPRRREPLLAIPFLAAAVLVLAGGQARAQEDVTGAIGGGDPSLLRPVLDGHPSNPPRFRGARKSSDTAPSRFGQLPNFEYQPAFGAGTTGFDSTNARKRRPGQAKSGQASAQAVAVGAATDPNASSTSTPSAGAAPAPPTRAFTPKQLQPAGAPLAGRIYIPTRPGAPPPSLDVPVAMVATTPPSRRLFPEEKPFDPLGVQLGAFLFRPAMEYTRGYDNNPARNSTPPAQTSWFNIYSPELLINSNWAVHEFNATIRGSYATYDTMHQLDRPNVDAKAVARVDVTSESRIDLEGRYLLFTDNPGSPNIQVGLSHLPIAMTYGGTAGVGQRFNRLDVSLKGSFDRTVYNDSEFTDGTSASNAGRNYNRYGLVLRTSYEVNPGVRPFIELGADRRQYDLEFDAGGVMRTSQGSYGKAGTTLELRPKLTGEIAVGYLSRSYFDPGLTDIRGYTFDATLTWLATALTTAKLISSTTVAESTLPGVSGSFTRETTLQVDHAFRRWLVATLKFTRGFDDYVGSPREDYRYIASSALAYYVGREIAIKGEYRQEWRYSNEPGNNYWAHVWMLGVRFQR
ncbi:MAG TPA: outer membrane beta-barrel protein [Xanthobacteraceae bacterium]|nr:outer membrane beta-barrel protein [Xanthobacteraceae bacterium]